MVILDAHIIIWNALKPEKLNYDAKITIQKHDQEDGLIIHDISL